jgi:uncharacterized protein (DUF58 family)
MSQRLSAIANSLTRPGRVVIGVGAIAMLLGLISGWREFVVLGIGCALATLVAGLWVLRPQHIQITRTLHPPRVTVGESAVGVVAVTNTTRSRIGKQNVEDQLGPASIRMSLPSLAPGETFEQLYTVPAEKRGLFGVGPVRLTRTDPLGLFCREQGQGSIEELWVRPRTRRLATISSGFARDLEGQTRDTDPRGSAAFHAIREFQMGDDLRHVHWRTTAKRGELMVRQFVDTRRSSEVVVLDTRENSYSVDAFEEAIEIAGSITLAAYAERRPCRLLLPGQKDSVLSEKLETLDRLALVKPLPLMSTPELLAPVSFATKNASALIIVSGVDDPADLIASARASFRSGLIVIVTVQHGSLPQSSTVGGCRVIVTPNAPELVGVWAETVGRS